MAERQQRLAERILQDPAVKSVSSFIGVDGANTTLNTGRLLIDLKPPCQRDRAPWCCAAWPMKRGTSWAFASMPSRCKTSPLKTAWRARNTSCCSHRPTWPQLQTSTADLVQRMRACRNWPMWPATCKTRACRPLCRLTAPRPAAWA